MDIQYGPTVPFDVKGIKADDSGWEVSGYASTYSNVDKGGDVVMRGAFDDWLAGWRTGANKTRFLYAHQQSMILGRVAEMKSDDRGLFVRAKISKTQLGQDVHTLLKDDALDSFSIGYVPTDIEYDDRAGVRKLLACDLLEFSLVAVPMNDQAVVTGVKARFCPECGRPADKKDLPTVDTHKCSVDLDSLSFNELIEHFASVVETAGNSTKSFLATLTGEGHELNESKQQSLTQLLGTFPGLDAVRSDVQRLLQAASAPPPQTTESALGLRLAIARRRLRANGVAV